MGDAAGFRYTRPNPSFIRWEMPYGCYYCADGREILFDHNDKPICQRYPGQAPTFADAAERVPCGPPGVVLRRRNASAAETREGDEEAGGMGHA